ncbi:NAD(P)-binding domain-containing protein [Oscillatoria sp. FACHB-1407]|uniref:NADPH-dependent F420 reductase n=1 Tax=Oscillatoria sp. FACHB-1407 TaxID=2692847 RepID=UPI001688B0B2|nr:NAD(P)-binding domain-containing protein [Oscillatoria sp. FACHB-1407]MBD2465942.1 NAD(P)-binding domain-containing protein [Oscillatoria sp. FACHB-1407]
MKIGIIGSGNIGGTVGKLWAKAGHQVLFSSRNPEKLSSLIAEAGSNAQADTVAEAVAFADVILVAVYYATINEAIAASNDWAGKTVIDATNPYGRTASGQVQRLPGVSSGLEFALKLPQSHIVKAYNTLPSTTLANDAHRVDPYVLFYCGDDNQAKQNVAQLIRDSGFVGLETGSLSQAPLQEPGGLLYNQPLTVQPARKLLDSLKVSS